MTLVAKAPRHVSCIRSYTVIPPSMLLASGLNPRVAEVTARIIARSGEEFAVMGDVGHAEQGKARLPGAQHFAGAAKPQANNG